MSAYVVALIRITDRESYAAYESRFMAVLTPFAGEVLAVDDKPKAFEGAWPGQRTVLLRFPDKKAAQHWYDSPAYQEIARDRRAGSNGSIALIAGLG